MSGRRLRDKRSHLTAVSTIALDYGPCFALKVSVSDHDSALLPNHGQFWSSYNQCRYLIVGASFLFQMKPESNGTAQAGRRQPSKSLFEGWLLRLRAGVDCLA